VRKGGVRQAEEVHEWLASFWSSLKAVCHVYSLCWNGFTSRSSFDSGCSADTVRCTVSSGGGSKEAVISDVSTGLYVSRWR
jgi:hypothetical protein